MSHPSPRKRSRTTTRGAGRSESRKRSLGGTAITFLLTDVQDSVQLWEQGVDAMTRALARHDVLIEHSVEHGGGVIVRPRGEGDSRFAVFDRASDAVTAALEIQRSFQQEPWPTSTPLRVRMALHTGKAEYRAGDYYGSDVNRCARLRGLAHGGQVLVSDLTTRLVQGNLPVMATLENIGEYRLRGLNEPERVFQLNHPELPGGFPPLMSSPSELGRTPFLPAYPFPTPGRLVGRDAELAIFDDILARGQSHGQVAFVDAAAGTGKSALLGAIVLRARDAGFACLAGGCYESGAVVPLRPFRDGLVDYVLSFPADVVRAELGSTIADLAEFVPELRLHLGLPERPGGQPVGDQAHLFGTLHAALRYLAARSPVLLCFEDLHVADAATLDLIQFLVVQTRRLPVMLIGTYRRDEVRPGQRLAQLVSLLEREGAHHIELGALNRVDTVRVAESILGGPTNEDLNDRVYATTEGIPFFVEQFVLALREQQRIDLRGGIWRPVADTTGLVPPIAREVIQERLDRLSEGCRQTLAMAAVLGQSVEHGTLLAAFGAERDSDLIDALDEGLTAQLLKETPTGYAFGHALLRETVYWGLSLPRRMQLHRRAAEVIQGAAGADAGIRAAQLSYHFGLAGPAPEMRARAVKYSMEAARAAARLSFDYEALNHFERACDVLAQDRDVGDVETRIEALEGRGLAQRHLAMWADCTATFTQVLAACTAPVQRAHAREAIAAARHHVGDTVGALAEVEAGLGELHTPEHPDAVAAYVQLEYVKALLHFLPGHNTAVLEIGEQMVRRAELAGRPDLLYRAHTVLGWGFMGQGARQLAADHYVRALLAAEQSSHRLGVAITHENLGMLCLESGDFDSARCHLDEAIALFRKLAREARAMNALQLLGNVCMAEGDAVQARGYAAYAGSLASETQDRREANCHELLGRVCDSNADWDEAAVQFASALAVHVQIGYIQGMVKSLVGRGHVYEQTGDWRQAREHYQRAVDVSDKAELGPHTITAHRHLGRLLRQVGDSEAIEHIRQARDTAERIPESIEYGPALFAAAELAADQGDLYLALDLANRALSSGITISTAVEIHAFAASVAARLGRPADAEAHATQAMLGAERLGAPVLLCLASLARAEAIGVADVSSAAPYYERALRAAETARAPYARGRILESWAEALSHSVDQRAQADELFTQARALFVQVGARPTRSEAAVLAH
ncbi:MAG: ATP-binding protein [Chloroflexota bacterium]